MAMSTVRQLIADAYRSLGVLARGEALTSAEEADALRILNQLIEEWSLQSLLVYAVVLTPVSVTPGKASYTLGLGGDWNLPRPTRKVEAMSYLRPGSGIPGSGTSGSSTPGSQFGGGMFPPFTIFNHFPVVIAGTSTPGTPAVGGEILEYPLTRNDLHEFQHIRHKSNDSEIPRYYYDNGHFPVRTITLWPPPSEAGTILLYLWKSLETVPDLDISVNFPPGYRGALQYNLAIALAPDAEATVTPELSANAARSLRVLKSSMTKSPKAWSDMALDRFGGHYDVRSDLVW